MCLLLHIFQSLLKNPLKGWPKAFKDAHNPTFLYISEIQNICSSFKLSSKLNETWCNMKWQWPWLFKKRKIKCINHPDNPTLCTTTYFSRKKFILNRMSRRELEDIQYFNPVTAVIFMQVCLDSDHPVPWEEVKDTKVSGKTCFTFLANSLEKTWIRLKIVENRVIINHIFFSYLK